MCHQSSKELSVGRAFLSAYGLRQKMLHFLTNFQYYMMVEVIEPNWSGLQQKLKHVSTVDEVLSWHSDFLDRCIKNCLIGHHQLLKIITKLMECCAQFAEFIERFTVQTSARSEQEEKEEAATAQRLKSRSNPLLRRYARVESDTARVTAAARSTAYTQRIQQFASVFDQNLQLLLSTLANKSLLLDAHVQNLFTRLDFNGFYTVTMQQPQPQPQFPPTQPSLFVTTNGAGTGSGGVAVAGAPSPSNFAVSGGGVSATILPGGRRPLESF